jgi:hypothetical protein
MEARRSRLRELAATHVRYGYRRLTVLLRREGWGGEREASLPALRSGEPEGAQCRAEEDRPSAADGSWSGNRPEPVLVGRFCERQADQMAAHIES